MSANSESASHIGTEQIQEKRDGSEKLTSRERQVLVLIAAGCTTKEIAARLGIAFKTAVFHRTRIMLKFRVHNSVTLVRYAIWNGLIEP
jgi:DNA-binding NarL/FixJ family response regulator